MIEDSTFEGWTRGPVLGYPTGSRVEGPALQHGFQGTVWSLPQADEESIKYAKRSWPERDADDFERVGRTWTDRRDGTAYRLVRGNPIAGLGLDGDTSAADFFCVADGVLWFLKRKDAPDTKTVEVGTFSGLWSKW